MAIASCAVDAQQCGEHVKVCMTILAEALAERI
jgi:hypothetical protein